jgi:flagellar operon protein
MVSKLNQMVPKPIGIPSVKPNVPTPTERAKQFGQVLDNAIQESQTRTEQKETGISFSKHALKRLKERNINLDVNKLAKIGGAIDKVAKKGSNESLVISNDAAFIVNVPKRKIITALDKAQMQENVFTNIDSTVIA